MACKRMIYREQRRKQKANKYHQLKKELRQVADNRGFKYSDDEIRKAQIKLRKLPRDASECRARNRCALCGRPRGYIGKFGLCRIHLRELAMVGVIPGLRMSSW